MKIENTKKYLNQNNQNSSCTNGITRVMDAITKQTSRQSELHVTAYKTLTRNYP